MGDRQRLGETGETLAGRFLVSAGYALRARRWRADGGRGPEADIVAERDGVTVFVEVRTRRGDAFGSGEESVDWRKRTRLRRVAYAYMAAQGRPGGAMRIDVIAVDLAAGVLRHVKGAVGED